MSGLINEIEYENQMNQIETELNNGTLSSTQTADKQRELDHVFRLG